MSTFAGKIQEISQISVDRFDGENFDSDVFFLSHCHSDHMVGLREYKFQNMLVDKKKYIYASAISCVILQKMFPYIKNNLRELSLDVPTTVFMNEKSVSVITLPAGHCPGSVMFLFEGDRRVLYTGDYRINKNDIKKFKSFYNSFGEVKIIDKLYLDTTFFLKSYVNFPTRQESLNELCKIIKEWTDKGKNYHVNIIVCAKYGYEYAFNEIFKQTRMPVHVNSEIYQFYSMIPEMDNSVTVTGTLTQVHSSCGKRYQTSCEIVSDSMVRNIRLSAMRWKEDDLSSGLSQLESNMYCVCFSTHASYEEGAELIRFLKPNDIKACVLQRDFDSNLEMTKLIEEHLQEFKSEECVESKENTPKLFDIENVLKKVSTEVDTTSSLAVNVNNDFVEILDSPPRTRRKM